jgi:hypothetical protein
MPNTVQAAAEGMPNTSRRTALAVTGSGLIAALGGLAMSTKQASPAPLVSAEIADCVGAYYAAAAMSIEACEKQQAAELSPDCPSMPEWKPATIRDRMDVGHCVHLRSSEYAELFFAEQIATARNSMTRISAVPWEPGLGASLVRGHTAIADRLETLRDEAIASLRAQEVAWAPIQALEATATDATASAFDAFARLIEASCHSLADVRAKAAALVHAADRLGFELEHDEMRKALLSLLGEQEA